MKRIALVTFTSSHFAFGLNALESYLRQKGHHVRTIYAFNTENNQYSLLTPGQLEILSGLVQGYDAVGVSLISIHSLGRARQVCAHLRETFAGDVILGGAPVVMAPELYLEFSDYVCLGEGEELLHQFLTNPDRGSLPNLGYRDVSGQTRLNPLAPLLDVDLVPVPTLDLKDTTILSDTECFELSERPEFFHQECLGKGYRVMMTRGCPFKCTFCCNNTFNALYKGLGKTVRKRDSSLVLQELARAKETIPGLDKVYFLDDDIMSIPLDEFRSFMERYSREIGLTVWELSTTFTSLSAEKLAALRDNGIRADHIRFGLQSASARMNKEVYQRPFNGPSIIEKIALCLECGHDVALDMILDNPYERLDDLCANVAFFTDLGARIREKGLSAKKLSMNLFSLKFYPGTELYRRALADGLIGEDYVEKELLFAHYNEMGYRSIHTYLVFVYYLALYGKYGWLCRLSSRKGFLTLLEKLLRLPFAEQAARAAKGLAGRIKRSAG